MDDREWLFDLAQEYAASAHDVVRLPDHIRTVSDEHLERVIRVWRELHERDSLLVTTAMNLYCAAARAEQQRRAK